MEDVVIVAAARTPMGAFQGAFKELAATELGAVAIRAALKKAGLAADSVSEVLMGCVLTAGLGQAPARQAALKAGLPNGTHCTTIGKVCGSGMQAVMIGHNALLAGSAEIVIAGGMESMTGAPYLMSKGRGGYRIGHAQIYDSMMLDGLEDAYEAGRSMGTFGELCAAKYLFTREAQDTFASTSAQRAQHAVKQGAFVEEIAPVTVRVRAGETIVSVDEGPARIKLEKISTLKPAFKKDGTITAASSSSINDGAAALVLMRASKAANLGLKPLAKIVGHATHAQEPAWFTTAPVGAVQKLFARIGWTATDVDLYEINEAFAVVPMAIMRELDIPHGRVNVNGGACALGHPIGASGARILVTLLHALKQRGSKRGIATLCIGGGEGTAVAIEMV